jgi:cytochrome c oxidase assembly protein subunit 15
MTQTSSASASYTSLLHRLALISAVCCFALLFLGGLVTSNQAGLSVPDWPTSFYVNMYAFPIKDWIGGIFFEHTHRLFASLVGLIILVQAIAWQLDLASWWKKVVWFSVLTGAGYLVKEFAGLVLQASSAEPGYAIALTSFLLILSVVVLVFVILLLRLLAKSSRPKHTNEVRIRQLAWISLVGVVIQGILGGLTVKYYLPVSISTSHATLGQTVFCLTLALAVLTGKNWLPLTRRSSNDHGLDLRRLSIITTSAVVLQLIVGAVMRHTQSGLAIPTFPLAFGKVVPDFTSFGVVINFAHRTGALIVSALVITMAATILRYHKDNDRLRRPAVLSLILLTLQITLGSLVIWYKMPVTVTTLHVSTGAAILGTVFYITIQSRHWLAIRKPFASVLESTQISEPTRLSVVSEA